MNKLKSVVALGMFLVLLVACKTSAPEETAAPVPSDTASPTETPSEPYSSAGLQEFTLPGITVYYPEGAHVETLEASPPALESYSIIGSEISIKPGDADWFFSGPAYELAVRMYDNPDKLDAETWARAYLISLWNQAVEMGGPMTVPVDESGAVKEEYVEKTRVAGYDAFRIEWFGGDSAIMEYFIAHGARVLSFSFRDYPVPNQPIAEPQTDIYALIMGTLHLEAE
jgi:hypothetical protein